MAYILPVCTKSLKKCFGDKVILAELCLNSIVACAGVMYVEVSLMKIEHLR